MTKDCRYSYIATNNVYCIIDFSHCTYDEPSKCRRRDRLTHADRVHHNASIDKLVEAEQNDKDTKK